MMRVKPMQDYSVHSRGVLSKGVDGFTLVEVAVVMIVFSLILVGTIDIMRSQSRQQKVDQANADLQEIKQALLGFIVVNDRLPCAASPGAITGIEDCATPLFDGLLPWSTLGVKPVDPWSHAYSYAVAPEYSSDTLPPTSTPIALTLDTTINPNPITIQNVDNTANIATGLAFMVVSHGSNSKMAYWINGNATRPTSDDPTAIESENADDDEIFRLGSDDLLMWIPPAVLKYTLVQAGTLP